jgi:hypothetical protein
MKIKDLPKDQSLKDRAFYHPETGEVYYWNSHWNRGVWAKKNLSDTQVFPLIVANINETLEWDLVE